MFNVDSSPTFTRTVKVKVPSGNAFEEQSFRATFRAVDNDAINGHDHSTDQGTSAFLRSVVVSLDDIVGADGPVSFSAELLDRVIAKQWARMPLYQTYLASLNGAAEGN